MLGSIIGIVLAVILAIWLLTSTIGLLFHVLGWIVLIAAIVWAVQLFRSGARF